MPKTHLGSAHAPIHGRSRRAPVFPHIDLDESDLGIRLFLAARLICLATSSVETAGSRFAADACGNASPLSTNFIPRPPCDNVYEHVRIEGLARLYVLFPLAK